jgi:hypothetical protein
MKAFEKQLNIMNKCHRYADCYKGSANISSMLPAIAKAE